jgi:hypothetical protein
MEDNKLTNEQALELYEKMSDVYGEHLPHPVHEPIRFAYYVRLFTRYHKNDTSTETNG